LVKKYLKRFPGGKINYNKMGSFVGIDIDNDGLIIFSQREPRPVCIKTKSMPFVSICETIYMAFSFPPGF